MTGRERTGGLSVPLSRLDGLLQEEHQKRIKLYVEVGVLLSEGATPADVREMLHVDQQQVREAMTEIAKVMPSPVR